MIYTLPSTAHLECVCGSRPSDVKFDLVLGSKTHFYCKICKMCWVAVVPNITDRSQLTITAYNRYDQLLTHDLYVMKGDTVTITYPFVISSCYIGSLRLNMEIQ
jgi:hypothetical protein